MGYFNDLCSNIKLIVSEVDGIVTEGFSPIDEIGNVPFKHFFMRDFEAINNLKREFKFVFLSYDNSVSYNLCRRKQIPFFLADSPKNKKDKLIEIMRRYNVSPEETIYLGNSFSDMECLMLTPFSVCTYDSPKEVKEKSYLTLDVYGGNGVVCALYELLSGEMKRRKNLTNRI
jgi:3-deoxy-D-manno-octulosonate 8-phosphate phosphatase KdsC-like HAD superfamily phosphatase